MSEQINDAFTLFGEIGLDDRSFDNKIKNVQSQLKRTEGYFRDANGRLHDLEGRFVSAGKSTNTFTGELDKGSKSSDQYKSKLEQAGSAVQIYEGKADKAGKITKGFKGDLDQAGRSTQKVTGDLHSLNSTSLNGITERIRSLKSGLSDIGGGGLIGSALSVASGNLISSAISKLGGAIGGFVKQGIDFDDLKERALITFETISGSADGAKQHLADLIDFGTRTPFRAEQLIELSTRLQGVGFNAKEVIPMLTSVGDAVAGLGNDPEKLESIVNALSRMKTEGRASGEAIRSLAIAGVPAYKMLAEAAGVSVSKIRKLAEENKIDADKAIEVIVAGMERKFPAMMKKVEGTYSALLSNLQDTTQQKAGQIFEPLFDESKKALTVGIKALDSGTFNMMAKGAAGIQSVFFGGLNSTMNALATGDFLGLAESIGEQLPAGLKEGILNGAGAALNTVTDFAGSAIDAAEKRLGVQSPSREFIRIGEMCGLGFSIGFDLSLQQETTKIIARVGDTLDKLADRFKVSVESLMQANPALVEKLRQQDERLPVSMADLSAGDEIYIPSVRSSSRNKAPRRSGALAGGTGGSLRDMLEQASNDPRVRALFEALRIAEGGAPDVVVGGKHFDTNNPAHPGSYGMGAMGPKGWSTAAGNWQITQTNWKKLAPQLGLNNFGDVHQQMLAALALYNESGGLKSLLSGDMKGAMAGTQPWASSPYSSLPGRKRNDFTELYEKLLGQWSQSIESDLQPPSEPSLLPEPKRPDIPTALRGAPLTSYSLPPTIGFQNAPIVKPAPNLWDIFSSLGIPELKEKLWRSNMGLNRPEDNGTWNKFVGQHGLTAKDLDSSEKINQLSDEYKQYILAEIKYRQEVLRVQVENTRAMDSYYQQLEDYKQKLAAAQSDKSAGNARPSLPVPEVRDMGAANITSPPELSRATINQSWKPILDDFRKLSAEAPGVKAGLDAAGQSLSAFGNLAVDADGKVKGLVLTGGSLKDRLKEIEDGIPTLKQQMDDFVAGLPEGIGDVFANAVKQWDGTFKGFFRSVAQGFSSMLKDMAAQLIKMAVMKFVTKLLGGFLGFSDGGLVEGFAHGGFVKRFAPGGYISGEGTSTSDSIPAMLSNGEFVMRAAAVNQFGVGFFKQLNDLKTPSRFAIGGLVSRPQLMMPSYASAGNSSSGSQPSGDTHYHNHHWEFHGVQNPEQFRQAQGQMEAEIAQRLQRSHNRYR
jgi:tape measure domain-containing protein